jgi:hypothetical protein
MTPTVLGVTSNYALMQDSSDIVRLNNKTAPIDAEEIIKYQSAPLKDGRVPTTARINHPAPVQNGIMYGVRVDSVLVTDDDANPDYRVDEPVVVSISIKHNRSGHITEQLIGEAVDRAYSALKKADGSWRLGDLMRSAERPVVD